MKSIEPRADFCKLFFFVLRHFKTAHQYYFHIDYLSAIALSANKAVCVCVSVCVCVLLSICVYVCIYVQFYDDNKRHRSFDIGILIGRGGTRNCKKKYKNPFKVITSLWATAIHPQVATSSLQELTSLVVARKH